ncbi:MAG: methyltransferase, TIGR04325 family, partial [Nitrospirota bacterium]|nr:methyltransferase, TIGR04325 family [Nitrospirota bacterium]
MKPLERLGIRKRLSWSIRRGHSVQFSGSYETWEAALADSTGYDTAVILERTREALLKVRNGAAAFERDSVLFAEQDYPFPIVAAMLREALASEGHLSVIDFGGSLGSSYFQCRKFFPAFKTFRWNVIEQPAHVACGRRDFETAQLRFHETIEQCLASKPEANAVLLSGVLPYLRDPHLDFENLLGLDIRTVIVDRTAFLPGDDDRLTVERVPAEIYHASYPFWFLSETKFLAR